MRDTRRSRSGSTVRSRIRRGLFNQRPWPQWLRPSRAIGHVCRPASSPTVSCPMPSSRASSMPVKRTPATSPDPGQWTRPSMSYRQRPTPPTTPCASGAVLCWAMAPAPARVARSPASSWTTGFKVVVGRCGSRSPTSSSRTLSATGRPWAWSACWSRRSPVSARARRSAWSRASFLPPTPRYGPTRARKGFRGSARSSIGWDRTSTE